MYSMKSLFYLIALCMHSVVNPRRGYIVGGIVYYKNAISWGRYVIKRMQYLGAGMCHKGHHSSHDYTCINNQKGYSYTNFDKR